MTPGKEDHGILYTEAERSSARIPVGLSSWEKLRKGGFVGQNTSKLWQLVFIASLLSFLFYTPSPSPSTPAGIRLQTPSPSLAPLLESDSIALT